MAPVSRLRLALRLLQRDWRAGELYLLIVAIVIAVASVTAVGFFSDRLNRAMTNRSADLVGADLALSSSQPVAGAWLSAARNLGLRHTSTLAFASVVMHGEATQLASVLAVAGGYPLRGSLRTAAALSAPDAKTLGIPAAGTAWVEARVLQALRIGVGSRITIGDAAFTITRVLTAEPGRARNAFTFAPRVLIAQCDVARTGVIAPGSRVTYGYQFTGAAAALERYKIWVKPHLDATQQLLDVRDDSSRIGQALQVTERYLGLASLLAVILAGVAIAMAAQRYSERHFDMGAMLRCLGATQDDIVALYLPQLLVLGIVASALGCALGWGVQQVIFYVLHNLLSMPIPAPGFAPLLFGMLTGLLALAGFALPPVLRLKQVPPLRVLRRDLVPLPPAAWAVYGGAGLAVAILLWRISGDLRLTFSVLAGGAVAITVLTALINLALRLGTRLTTRGALAWRLGLRNVLRRSRTSIGQILAFGLALMAMAVIVLLRTDLLSTWQTQLQADTPNYFAFNILPQDVPAVARFFRDKNIRASAIYPLVRGRLTAINNLPVSQAVAKNEADNDALRRELNLTWTDTVPPDNALTRGVWWSGANTRHGVSVEEKLAAKLGIKLGDALSFTIGSETLHAQVSSFRSVKWDSFHPNFYMIFPPGMLDRYPATYLTSFYLPLDQRDLITPLIHAFPTVTVLDVDQVLGEVRSLLAQVSSAIELVLALVLAAGFAVLFAAIATSHDERRYEGALLRALGATRPQVRGALLTEFIVLGVLAGVLAASGTELIAYLLYSRVFDLAYHFKWPVWIAAPLLGGALIGAAGLFGTRRVLQQSPLQVLRGL